MSFEIGDWEDVVFWVAVLLAIVSLLGFPVLIRAFALLRLHKALGRLSWQLLLQMDLKRHHD